MTSPTSVLAPKLRTYRGFITDPERWSSWIPRRGDVLVCTPPKCGTTWTQTMVAMLIHKETELPEAAPVLSPWVDGNLGVPADEVAAALDRQTRRRVVKTHTPADGFPIWRDVSIIAVYRHPLDVFFSLRKHSANMREPANDTPMRWPLKRAFRHFIEQDADIDDFDRDTLATITLHYTQTVLSDRLPDLKVFHYSDLLLDGRAAVERLAAAVGIEADTNLIARIAEASSFRSMKAKAADFAPVGGTGFWKSDANFFDSATSGKWQSVLSTEDLHEYNVRLQELVPDVEARAWLEFGDASKSKPTG